MRTLPLVVLLAACAHAPNLPLRPEAKAPEGEDVGSFAAKDGTQLWRRHWLATGETKGVLIIQHGLRDHSDNYDHLARKLVAAGFSVWAADLRGHARSAGPRVAPNPWHDYIDDFEQFIGIVRAAEPGKPIFVMGHSMGGAIVALTVAEKKPAGVAGMILSAPVLNLGVPPFVISAIRLMGATAPSLGVLKLDPKAFSTNPAIATALVKDDLVEQGAGPARTASGLADGAADIFDHIGNLTLPILALHGTIDQLTAPSGSRALIELAPSTDKTLKIYDGFAHDLVHEPRGAQVEDDIAAWLAAHTGGPALPPTPIYRGKLRGDPSGRLLAVQIGGGISRISSGGASDTSGLFETRVRFGYWEPFGHAGALRIIASGDGFIGSLMPAGVGVKLGPARVGVTAGVGTLPSGFNLTIPVAGWIELSSSMVHITLDAQLDYRVSDTERVGPLSSDLLDVGLTLRAPGDRWYWPHANAGVGPYLRGAMLDAGGPDPAYTVTLGLQLFGSD
jgi:acylglycerol lipase